MVPADAPARPSAVTLPGGRLTGIPTGAGPLTYMGVLRYGKEYQLLGLGCLTVAGHGV